MCVVCPNVFSRLMETMSNELVLVLTLGRKCLVDKEKGLDSGLGASHTKETIVPKLNET